MTDLSGPGAQRPAGSSAGGRRLHKAGWAGVAVAVLLLLPASSMAVSNGGTVGPSAHAWLHASTAGFGTWSNGRIDVAFPSHAPSLSVVSLADPRVATTLRVAGVAEVTSEGEFAAYAPFSSGSSSWLLNETNVSGTLLLRFNATAPVLSAQGSWEAGDDSTGSATVVGNASFEVDVFLNTSATPSNDSVRVAVNSSGWPWQDGTDALGLDLRLVAANQTRIASAYDPVHHQLDELANSTNAAVATLSWAPAATVAYSDGSSDESTVASYSNTTSDGANSTVRLLFASVSGGYSAISYDPWVALHPLAFHLPVLPAWALDLTGWVVLGGAAGATALLAVAALRRRPRRSDELD